MYLHVHLPDTVNSRFSIVSTLVLRKLTKLFMSPKYGIHFFFLQGLWETKQKSNYFNDLKSESKAPQVYMAPEAMEHFQFTQAADVYSFGMRIQWHGALNFYPK